MITVLKEQVKPLQGQVEEHFARVLGEFGDDPWRYRDWKARKNYAAPSPLTRAPGK